MSQGAVGAEATKNRSLFFRLIYGRAQGYACIATLQARKMTEQFFNWPADEQKMLDFVEQNAVVTNVYYCPQLFDTKERKKEHVKVTPNAWADLDTCNPNKLLVEPTVTIQSSPKRYQAIWVFESPIDPDDAEDLSRRIAYKHADDGADRSGWDLTQLLRVPGTYNLKYNDGGTSPVVTINGINTNRYRMSDFDEYPASPQYAKVDMPFPEQELVAEDPDDLLQRKRQGLNPLVWTLYSEEPQGGSWSEVLWRLLMLLFEHDFTREEVYVVANAAKCNKWARDGRPAVMLWKEVCRAEARAALHHRLLVSKPEELEPLLSEEERGLVDKLPDTFVERYMAWASALGDAAPQYHQAGAFVALSSLLAGNVVLPTSFGTFVPNIWFMILADTTLTRKTTSMDIAMEMIEEIDSDIVMATDGSIEGLLTSLSTRPGRPSVFLRDEFSGLLESMAKKDYMAGMPELLTKLYDGKMQKRILRKETIEVRDPRLIVFAGGIKNRVTGGLNYDMVSSGFMPRFVFITAESDIARVRPIGPPTVRTTGDREAITAELRDMAKFYNKQTILTIARGSGEIKVPTSMKFEASLSDEAWIRYNELEAALLQRGLKSDKPDILTPVGDRLAKSILKAAVLIAASENRHEPEPTVPVTIAHILRAIKYGEQWYKHAMDIMESVGKGSAERQLDTIARVVLKNPQGISRSSIMQGYHLSARQASEVFDTLEQRGRIRRQRSGRTELLFPVAEERKLHG